jgi:hypothetical protein
VGIPAASSSSSTSSPPQAPASSPAPPGTQSVTLSGCTCAKWRDAHSSLAGCANPDRDPAGPWCRVDIRTCMRTPERPDQAYGAWDYCPPPGQAGSEGATSTGTAGGLTPALPARTWGGCACKVKWALFGDPGGIQGNDWQYGCSRPDGSPTAWCVVDPASCSNTTYQYLADGNGQPFDYCTIQGFDAPAPAAPTRGSGGAKRGGPSATAAAGTAPPPPQALSQPNATRTLAGCACLTTWKLAQPDGSAVAVRGGVCATASTTAGDDPAGPRCQVDAKTCQWQPFGQDSR